MDGTLPQLHYLGFVRAEHLPKVHEAITAQVYEHWDNSSESGPKTRPRESDELQPLGLKVLASANGIIQWPQSLSERFPQDTPEHKALEAKHEEFLQLYPQGASTAAPTTQSSTPSRSNAKPDFSIDHEALPLDPNRAVDLPGVSVADFTAQRQDHRSKSEIVHIIRSIKYQTLNCLSSLVAHPMQGWQSLLAKDLVQPWWSPLTTSYGSGMSLMRF